MSVRFSLLVCGLSILGCAAPAVGTVPAAPPPEAPVAVVATTDTGDAVADAPEGREPAPRAEHPEARKVPGSGPDATPAPAPEPVPKADPKRPVCPKPAGISQVNDRSWTVTRSLVDQWQENPYSLGNVQEDGEGWQLVGTRQHPAYHLGMRNGDIVLEVNGHKLNTTPNLLAAYLACKNDTRFDVVFLRKGNRMTHHYEIVN